MFGEVIGEVTFSFGPVDFEFALVDTVLDPVKSHVHGFGAFDFGGVVGEAFGGGVVGDESGGAGLHMAELGEDLANVRSFLAINE